jgi:hypothetical protein
MADDNGTTPGPPPADPAAAEAVPMSEMLMGVFGLAVAIGIAFIAIDLMTGGGISRIFPVREATDDG